MTLEEVLANPNMNCPGPMAWSVLPQGGWDNPQVPVDVARIIERERREERDVLERGFVKQWHPAPKGPGCFDDWAAVYHEEVTRPVEIPPDAIQAAVLALQPRRWYQEHENTWRL